VDVYDDGLDAIALRVALGARLLGTGDRPFGLAVEVDDHVAALKALDVTILQLPHLVGELDVDLLTLGLADLLIEDLFGRLRGDAAEVLGLLGNRDLQLVALLDLGVDLLGLVRADLRVRVANHVDDFLGDVAQADRAADFDRRIDLAGLIQGPLSLGIFDLILVLDDFLDHKHLHGARIAVQHRFHRLARLVVLARSGSERVFQRLEDPFDVDGLLVRQGLDVLAQILVEHWSDCSCETS